MSDLSLSPSAPIPPTRSSSHRSPSRARESRPRVVPITPPPSPPPTPTRTTSPRPIAMSSSLHGRRSAATSPAPLSPHPRSRHSTSSSNTNNDLPPLPTSSWALDSGDPSPATSPARSVFPSRPASHHTSSSLPRASTSSTPLRHSLAITTAPTTRVPFPSPPLPLSASSRSTSETNLRPRAPTFEPRSAVANYFNVDFSFLYDEEPPSARRKRESAGSGSLKKKAGSRNSLGACPGLIGAFSPGPMDTDTCLRVLLFRI